MLNLPDEGKLTGGEIEDLTSEEDSTANDGVMSASDNEEAFDNSSDDEDSTTDNTDIIENMADDENACYDSADDGYIYDNDAESNADSGITSENIAFIESKDRTDETASENKPAKKKSLAKGLIRDLIFYAVLIFVCIYIIPNYVLQRTIVDGISMEDTLKDKDQLYVEKISYHFDALKRFDVIVFYPYGRDCDDYYVKRIIGLPGEKVQIIGSNIYINDQILEENYGKESIENPGRASEPIYLADDEYFVMGDNRNRSKDSRSPEVGNVKKENIGGRVILRIYPFNRFGLID